VFYSGIPAVAVLVAVRFDIPCAFLRAPASNKSTPH
jgi:hypothetical protein